MCKDLLLEPYRHVFTATILAKAVVFFYYQIEI
jgi:hypothetical protein